MLGLQVSYLACLSFIFALKCGIIQLLCCVSSYYVRISELSFVYAVNGHFERCAMDVPCYICLILFIFTVALQLRN